MKSHSSKKQSAAFTHLLKLQREITGLHKTLGLEAPDVTILRVPRASWEVLRESLELDAQSAAFDHGLREEICTALDSVEELI